MRQRSVGVGREGEKGECRAMTTVTRKERRCKGAGETRGSVAFPSRSPAPPITRARASTTRQQQQQRFLVFFVLWCGKGSFWFSLSPLTRRQHVPHLKPIDELQQRLQGPRRWRRGRLVILLHRCLAGGETKCARSSCLVEACP